MRRQNKQCEKTLGPLGHLGVPTSRDYARVPPINFHLSSITDARFKQRIPQQTEEPRKTKITRATDVLFRRETRLFRRDVVPSPSACCEIGLDWGLYEQVGRPGGPPARNQAASGLRLHNSSARETRCLLMDWTRCRKRRRNAGRDATVLLGRPATEQSFVPSTPL